MALPLNRRGFLQVAAGGVAGLATAGVTLGGISELNAAIESEQMRELGAQRVQPMPRGLWT